uniref:Glutathione S-transferase n=1 Tax=Aegilops tauschii TaxID=37682 RepID=R7W2U8_AEGTA
MADEDELKLLSTWASPWASMVKLALHLKGLSYENIEQDLNCKSDLLLAFNPVHKKVPVLIHNGKPICESVVIIEYIDEAYGSTSPSLLPTDPYERAIARFWVDYIDHKLVIPWKVAFTANTEEDKIEAIKQILVGGFTISRHKEPKDDYSKCIVISTVHDILVLVNQMTILSVLPVHPLQGAEKAAIDCVTIGRLLGSSKNPPQNLLA